MAAAGLALTLGACGRTSTVADSLKTFQNAVFGQPDLPLTREQVAKLPYASMRAKIGKGPDALMILGRIDGPDLHWVSVDRVVIATRNGRIVRTASLPLDNLKNTAFGPDGDPVTNSLHVLPRGGAVADRYVDFERERRFGTPLRSWFEVVGQERIVILDLAFDCVVVREIGEAQNFNWNFENRYWAETTTGFVWKSVQTIARDIPPISIQMLKVPT